VPLEYKKIATIDDIKIEEIKVNGEALQITDKTVNIEIPTDTGKVDDVTLDGNSVVENKVAKLQSVVKSTEGEYPLAFEDEEGNISLAITEDGNIKTKNFDSKNVVKSDEATEDVPFAIKDDQDNIVLQVKSNGHLQTKAFNSEEVSLISETGNKLTLDSNTYRLSLKDKNDIELSYVKLTKVALTGDYQDLINKPTIPTIPNISVQNGDAEAGKYISQIQVDATDKHKLIITKTSLPSLNFIPTSQKGAPNGVAELDSSGKVPADQLPPPVDLTPLLNLKVDKSLATYQEVSTKNMDITVKKNSFIYLDNDGVASKVSLAELTRSNVIRAEVLSEDLRIGDFIFLEKEDN